MVQALSTRGTTLVMAVVPSRVVVAAAAGEAPPGIQWQAQRAAAAYRAALVQLRAMGVVAPDLQAVAIDHVRAGGRFWLGLDSHWTQQGAAASARAVAQAIEATPAAASLRRAPQVAEPQEGLLRRPADLSVKLARLCEGEAIDQTLVDHHFGAAQAVGPLEEQPSPQVVLVGTSFSDHRFGFPGFLQQALSSPVLDVHDAGGGPLTGLQRWLLGRPPKEVTPAVLVWELPVGLLTGYGGGGGPEFDDASTWRQLVAAAWGECTDADLLDRGRVVPGVLWTPLLRDRTAADGMDRYVVLRTHGEMLTEFTLQAHYRDGRTEVVPLRVNPRLGAQDTWFVHLHGVGGADLQRVEIRVPQTRTQMVKARLCRAPGM
jgi:hypothetical protein